MLLVPTVHPAALLRRSGGDKDLARFFQTVVADIRKARRLAYEHPQWDESCIWGRDASGRLKAIFPTLQELHAFRVAARGYDLAVDVETTGNSPLECRLICVGMASANGSYICVPFLKQGGSPYWSPDEGRLAWELVCQLMADSLTPKVLHNGSFDKLVMETFGAQLDYSADTMQATHCTDSELPLGLGFVATRHLDIAYWKDDAKGAERWLDLPDEQLRVYNARDCLTTLRLKPILEAEVWRLGLWSLYQEEIAVCKMMTRSTRRGLMMDFERRDSTTPGADGKPIGLGPRLVLQRDEALSKLRMVAGSTGFDPQKPEHLRFLLFQQLKLPIVKETKTGLPSTDKDAMVLLALAADSQAQKYTISALTDWKVSQKKISGWTGEWADGVHAGGLPILGDGCLHPQWKMTPNTGRLASSPNAQNWGPDVKKLFRCAPGRKLTGVDLSQAELRFIGYEANDRFLLTAYEQGIDVHTVNMALYLKMRFAEGHEQANPQTVEYIKQTVGQLYPGVTYESLPVVPKHREKASRTLTKIGEFACLAADTKVALLDGSKPICEVKTGDWTWCWNGKEYEHTRVVKAWSTGVRRCVRLTVVDGVGKQKTITLTPDHKMLLRDGGFKPASELQPGESLMPFRRWKTGLGYSMLDPTNDQSEVYEHRQVVKDAPVVHHKNEVRSDNRPENLQSMSHKEHRNEHGPAEITPDGMRRRSEATKDRWSRDHNELVAKMTTARVASPAWRASTRARLKKAAATRAAKPRIPCARCGEAPVEKGLCPKCWRVKYAEDNPGWWRKYTKPKKVENHKVVSVEEAGDFEVWDIEVEHPAHNFALEKCVFVSNSNYRAMAETAHAQIRAAKDPKTNAFFFADLPLSQVEALLMRKERARPDLVRWWRENQRKTETDGFQKCAISGRMRFFRGGFKVTEVANWKIQTGIASWMNKCMLEIQATYDKETGGDCLIVQQVHDALNADGADEYAVRAGQVMEEVLGREFSLPGHPVARLPPDKAKYGTHLDEV